MKAASRRRAVIDKVVHHIYATRQPVFAKTRRLTSENLKSSKANYDYHGNFGMVLPTIIMRAELDANFRKQG